MFTEKITKSGLSVLFLTITILMAALTASPVLAKQNDVLPSDAMAAIAKAISKDLSASYDIEKVGDGYTVENRTHNLKVSFSHEEIRFCKANTDDSYAFTLTGIGYDTLETPRPAEIKALGNRIEFRRGRGLTEWYLNTPLGLEQGFTLDSPPGNPAGDSHARLELTLQGSLDAVLQDDRTLAFKNSAGQTVTRYAGLYVYDADKKPQPARLEMRNDKLIILFDDSHARYPVTVDPWIQTAKLTAGDAAADDFFGWSVAVSGDTAVVGAYKDDDGGTASGSAYVFERDSGGADNWGQTAKLTASDAAADDQFGYSVAVSGDTAVVGAYHDNDDGTNSGSAYVFEKGAGWSDMTETAKLTASDAVANDEFGISVAVSGDTAVVGAYYDGSHSGSAYVFERDNGGADNWGQTAKLTASDAAVNDLFGFSVAVSGNIAVVGAYGDDSDSGSAYVFERDNGGADNWGQTTKLTAGDAAADDSFGYSVAFSGDTAVIAAYRDDDGGTDSGSAYVFERDNGGADNWGQTAKLTASDAAATDQFGRFLAFSGDTAVVGAFLDDDAGSGSGSAYLFEKGAGWSDMTQTAKLTASDAAFGDNFGRSVAVSGDTAVVGACFGDAGVLDSGSAYVFELPQPEINLKQGPTDIADGGGHDFGSKVTGTDTDTVFTVENIGDADLTLTTPLTIAGAHAGEFGIQAQPTSPVTAGGSVTFTVRFSPATTGAKSATISIVNNDGDENPYVLNLQGTGTAPEIHLKQDVTNIADGGGHDFGSKVTGTDADTIFTVENIGSADLTLTTPLTIAGADAGEFGIQAQPTSPVTAGGSVTFTVRFSPATTGAKSATISITNNDSDENPYVLNLQGTGTLVPAPEINLKQGAMNIAGGGGHDFGGKVTGTDTDTVFTVENIGSADLILTTPLTIAGAHAGEFSIQAQPTSPVTAGGSVTFTVRFSPATAGAKSATISITNNDSDENPYVLNIQGTSTLPGTGTLVTHDFGDAPDGPYPTLLANDGARHIISGGVYIGSDIDGEADGQPDATADGDDNDDNDEDGVEFTSLLIPGSMAGVAVTADAACTLSAWIDFDADGDWDDTYDELFPGGRELVPGVNELNFAVPHNAIAGGTFARFRCTTDGPVSYTGEASDGEVEDYAIVIGTAKVVILGQQALGTFQDTDFTIDTAHLHFYGGVNPGGLTLTVYDGEHYTHNGMTITPDAGFYGYLTVPVSVNDGNEESPKFNVLIGIIAIVPDRPLNPSL
ncbi:choice-of-anchor D domain-containing protein [Desulfococcaceae bacterium HSG7]|nr:choice-of-anchor D domain-containing protein [Desulfococcaceae bacterium HSG7]